MSSLYMDLQSGISGDMAVSALLSLSGDKEQQKLDMLKDRLSTLPLTGFRIESSHVQRNGMRGNTFSVTVDERKQKPRDFRAITKLLDDSGLGEDEKVLSQRLFEVIAQAEARVHGGSPGHVHFHEIGAVDSIVDIVSFSILYTDLAPEKTVSSVPSLGSGITVSMHGSIPVPAPATLEILAGLPIRGTDRKEELVTPTGASIVKCVVSHFGRLPECSIRAVGYGFGQRKSDHPNLLRVLEIDEVPARDDLVTGTVHLIEATVDDSTPEEIGFLQEILFREGALDMWTSPVYMKKNRPGLNICVVCTQDAFDRLCTFMLKHSSTFGLRYSTRERLCLKRTMKKVHTAFGDIGVKVGLIGQDIVKVSPEYEDCRKAALLHNVPLRIVFDAAQREASRLL
jgi:uncharacterized protein (TIGR00299 family) protein